ncbi:MAG: tail fiber domain-containing protein [Bacteroidota bacterium]
MAYINSLDGAYHTLSDVRFKKGINKMGDVLDKVMSLQPKTYQFKANNPKGIISTGFIAQEIMPFFPEFVSDFIHPTPDTTDDKVYHGINYAGFSVIAIKAIQEQQQLIDAANEKNKVMLGLIEKMQIQIDALTKRIN